MGCRGWAFVRNIEVKSGTLWEWLAGALGYLLTPLQAGKSKSLRGVGIAGKRQTLANKVAVWCLAMYGGSQDGYLFQPIYLYLPLLAHGSGIGGVGSSERLAGK
jgi:hypothetical protein